MNSQKILEESKNSKVIVKFEAPWCGPCVTLNPQLQKLETEMSIKVIKVNIDENYELVLEFNIHSIPTLIKFENGEEKDRLVGSVSYPRMKEWAEQ